MFRSDRYARGTARVRPRAGGGLQIPAPCLAGARKLDNPDAPVWSKVHLTNAEALGCGTIAYDHQAGRILPHVHVTLGLKERAADGYTSHLIDARVQFLVEMILVEVTAPAMTRPADPALYDVPRLSFGGQ